GEAYGTPSITYTWNFGDGSGETSPSTDPVATHSFGNVMTYTVEMTATNSCSGDGVMFSRQVQVYESSGYNIYLPILLRNYVNN
ncbi:MAG: PKD domain-containing protein, partial [Chloroflexi bacterium]|nr:PKD domain-containing protein [Chloroflexota bacterium]